MKDEVSSLHRYPLGVLNRQRYEPAVSILAPGTTTGDGDDPTIASLPEDVVGRDDSDASISPFTTRMAGRNGDHTPILTFRG